MITCANCKYFKIIKVDICGMREYESYCQYKKKNVYNLNKTAKECLIYNIDEGDK